MSVPSASLRCRLRAAWQVLLGRPLHFRVVLHGPVRLAGGPSDPAVISCLVVGGGPKS